MGWGNYFMSKPLGTIQETVAEKGVAIKLNTELYGEFIDWKNAGK